MPHTRTTDEWSHLVRRQQALARLGERALAAVDVHELLVEAVAVVSDALAVPTVAVFEHDAERGRLDGRAARYEGAPVSDEAAAMLHLPTGRGSMPGFALLSRATVVTDDLLNDPRFVAMAPTLGVGARAALGTPVGAGDQPWGVLSAYSREVRPWSTEEIAFLEAAAGMLGLGVARLVTEEALRSATVHLDLSLAAGGLGAWSWTQGDRRVTLSASALDLHGITAAELDALPDHYGDLVHPDDRVHLVGAVEGALAGGDHWSIAFRVVRHHDRAVRWMQAWGQLVTEAGRPPRLVGVCADVTDRVADQERREAELAAETVARLRAEQAGARLATLSEASNLFTQSLEPEVILAALADFCVPLLADVCRVETTDDHGALVTSVVRGIDPERVSALEALTEMCPGADAIGGAADDGAVPAEASERTDPSSGVARAAPTVFADLGAGDYERVCSSPDQHRELARLGPTSVVVAPLVARNQVIGRLTLIDTDRGRRHPPDHLEMVTELAARAAVALDNGRLHESRARMVESLQSVLVPRALPDADGVEFAARYHAATPSEGVGGDFYDVFEIADHRWGVLVGDVCGRGPDAAALTGLVRHSIRAAAVRDPRPLQVLAQTNDAVIDQIDDFRFCTATYVLVERGSGGVVARLASAGHPRPVVLRAGQPPELVACSGVLLGVVRRPELVEIDVHLGPGDALVLYTDGVTEARGTDGLFGEERLVEVLGAVAGGSAEEIAASLEAAVGAHRRSGADDLAILVVQATGAPDSGCGTTPSGPARLAATRVPVPATDGVAGAGAAPSGSHRPSEGPRAERV